MIQHIKKLLLGNGLAQAIQLLSLLVLSRLYAPGDFGLLAQVQAVATFSTIIATLQLHLATPLSQSADEARTLTSHTQSIALAFTFALIVPALLLGRMEAYSIWLTLAIALINTYNGYLIYKGDFASISRFYVIRACIVVTFQLLFALLELKDGLVLGTLLAETLAAFYLMKVGLDHRPRLKLQPRELLNSARQHKAFTLYGTAQELVSVAAFYSPLILYGIYFGTEVAGQYAMASRLVWAPTVLLSKNIAQAVYYESNQSNTIDIKRIRTTFINKKIIAIISIIGAAILYGKSVTLLILGKEWALAADFIPIISIWALAFLAATPFRVLYRTLRIQKNLLFIDASLILLIASSFVFIDSLKTILWLVALSAAALQVGSIGFIHRKVKLLTTKTRE